MSGPDRPVPVESLLAHAGWVRALAWELVHDKSQVDDVVQQALVAALRSPPREAEKVRAWFRTVVKNLARETYRSEQARTVRERAAARPEAAASSQEVFERAEAHRRVVAAVLALPPPYAEVLLLRFFEDLPPRRIAARLEENVETVKSRLKRGLALLRERLSDDGEPWQLVVLPLLVPAPGGSGAPASPSRLGGRLRAGALVGALLAVSAAVWLSLPSGGGTGGGGGAPVEVAGGGEEASGSLVASRRGARRASAAAEREPGPAEDAAPAGGAEPAAEARSGAGPLGVRVRLEGRELLGVDTAAGIPLVFTPITLDPGRAPPPRRLVAGGDDVAFELEGWGVDGPGVVAVEVRVAHDGLVPTRVQAAVTRAGPGAEVAPPPLRLVAAGIVEGRVLAPGGGPAVDAEVGGFVEPASPASMRLVDQARAEPDGGFHLRLEPGVEHRVLFVAPETLPTVRTVVPVEGVVTALEPVELSRGGAISGRVRVSGRPPPGRARVHLSHASLGFDMYFAGAAYTTDGSTVACDLVLAECDPEGRFRVAGLPPTEHRAAPLVEGMAGDLGRSSARPVTPGGGELELDVAGGTIELRVTGPERGVPGATVRIPGNGGPTTYVTTDSAGDVRVLGLPGVSYRLAVSAPGFVARTIEVVAPGSGERLSQAVELEPEAPPASWRVELPDAPSTLESAAVRLFASDARAAAPAVQGDLPVQDRGFVLPGIPPGRYLAVVRPGAAWDDPASFFAEIRVQVEFAPGAEVRSTLDVRPAGRLRIGARAEDGSFRTARFRILDRDGRPVEVFASSRQLGIAPMVLPGALADRGPSDLFPALPPGRYRLELTSDGHRSVTRSVDVRAGKVTEVLIDLEPE